jgi:hypothetical protein
MISSTVVVCIALVTGTPEKYDIDYGNLGGKIKSI